MTDLYPIIRSQEFFKEFSEEDVHEVVGCATNIVLHQGQYVFREREPANHFYLVRHGRVSLELLLPGRGLVVVETIEEGEPLGWSWLIPPYRWHFAARCDTLLRAIALDGECLRKKCDANPKLGYHLMFRMAQMMESRLQASILRMLDVYGGTH